MKRNYTIALCDILGFSAMVQRKSLDNLVNNVIGWFQQATCHAMNKDSWHDGTPTLSEIDRNSLIGIAWFSDTILFWTKEDDDSNLREIIQTVAWLTFANVHGNTRIRGAISYGEAFIDPANSLFVGKPIIDAYRLESQQQWSGVALTESAVARVPAKIRDGRFADWPVVRYSVPLKNDITMRTLAIDWTYGIHTDLRLDWSPTNPEPTEEDWKSKYSICEKWKNTRQFHTDVCKYCNRTSKYT
jgi:hypothetical protein